MIGETHGRWIRPSLLSRAERCGLVPVLAKDAPESSAADAGREKHAELAAWVSGGPRPEWLPESWTAKGTPERKVQLRDPESGDLVTEGTADLVSVEGETVSVLDWKSGRGFGVPPVDDNLQLHAYALAVALETPGATHYQIVLAFTDREHIQVSRLYHEDEWFSMLDRIKRAATRRPVAVVGPHCDSCFERLRCPAHLLPADPVARDLALVPLTSTDVVPVEAVLRLHRAVKALDALAEKGSEFIKAWIAKNGPIRDGVQELALVEVAGRRSIAVAKVEKAGLLPQLEEAGCVATSAPSHQLRWRKA